MPFCIGLQKIQRCTEIRYFHRVHRLSETGRKNPHHYRSDAGYGQFDGLLLIALLTKGKPKKVIIATIIASQPAIDFMKNHFSDDVTLWTAAVDPGLNEHSYIIPGLGDAGYLAYGEKL